MPTREKYSSEMLGGLSSHMIINGEAIPYPNPNRRWGHKIVQNGKHLCVDGYEWVRGYWRITLRSVLYFLCPFA